METNKESPLFVQVDTQKAVYLTELSADYFIDTSGSTAGSILKYEQASVETLAGHLKPRDHFVSWNSAAQKVQNLAGLRSTGGTDPCTFAQFITEQTQCIVVYTDGQIGVNDMERFKTVMANKITNIPVVIVFAVTSLDATIQRMEQTINMSIPEAFLSLSNDVIIVITCNSFHKILMAKGCFNAFPTVPLAETLNLSDLPNFEFPELSKITIIGGLPSNVLKLKNVAEFIDLNVLYTLEDLPMDILEGLNDRTILPKLNLHSLHALLNRMQRKLTDNPELDRVRDELWKMAMSAEAGTEKHQQLIQQYHDMRSSKKSGSGGDGYSEKKSKVALINRLMETISEYQRNSTAIVFGSNRANRSLEFDPSLLNIVTDCIQIECPILLTEGNGCLLIKEPTDKPNFIEEFTSDYAMEAPFEFGTWLVPLITPGVFSQEMAEIMNINPYTREAVMGYLPISDAPAVIMRHMSKLFGGQKELWHFVRGYIAMMTKAVSTLPWLADYKDKITASLTELLKKYNADKELRSGNEKIPLYNALQHVLTHYSVCMRDRTYADNEAIISIAQLIFPDFTFDEQRIRGMITVVKEFAILLAIYKKEGTQIRDYVMEVDDYNHYVAYTPGVKGLVAQILWYDAQKGDYKLLKLHLAIEKALNDKKFGASLKKAMNGESFDEAAVLECKTPEPTGSHFVNPEPFFAWDATTGLPECQCIYCGVVFPDAKAKLTHLKAEFGAHFYNGHSIVRTVCHEFAATITDEKELYKKVRERLYRAYGDKNKAFHTMRSKNKLLEFIRLFMDGMHAGRK